MERIRENRQKEKKWRNPLIYGPRASAGSATRQDPHHSSAYMSIRSDIGQYGAENLAGHRVPSTSADSEDCVRHQSSIPQVGQAEQASRSSISSDDSPHSYSTVRKATTPRTGSRTPVSASGSPAEPKRTGILQDISGNSAAHSRQASNATQCSNRSSNGNPFQWDQLFSKPSALKSNPNARKDHRIQN